MPTPKSPCCLPQLGPSFPCCPGVASGTNYLMYMLLWTTGTAISGVESRFFPALREAPRHLRHCYCGAAEDGDAILVAEPAGSTERGSPKILRGSVVGGVDGAEHHSLTGVRIGAPLVFSSTTTNLAGSVLLALRPTT